MKQSKLYKVCSGVEIFVGTIAAIILLVLLIPFAWGGIILAAFGDPFIIIAVVLIGGTILTLLIIAVVSAIRDINAKNKKVEAKTTVNPQ